MTDIDRPWQSIDAGKFSQQIKSPPGTTATVEITLSPYDIPEGVRSFYDAPKRIYVVEFRYFGDHEDLRFQSPRSGLTLKFGKASGRIYRIEISETLKAGKLEVVGDDVVDAAIADVAGDQKQWRLEQNLNVARKIVAEHKIRASAG